ncbi:MAG: FkbM family methyltransferase [Gemmataceae bacterium]
MNESYLIETVCCHTLSARDLVPGMVVLDLGANRGEFSRTMADRYAARCYAVEASPAVFAVLEETAQVRKFHYAVWSKVQDLTFHLSGNSECSSLHEIPAESPVGQVTVPGIDLDTLVRRHALPPVDLLKVDIEGAEIEALAAASDRLLAGITQITVEFHDFNGQVDGKAIRATRKRLESLGFLCLRFSLRDHCNTLFLNRAHSRTTYVERLRLRALPYALGALRALGLPAGRLTPASGDAPVSASR